MITVVLIFCAVLLGTAIIENKKLKDISIKDTLKDILLDKTKIFNSFKNSLMITLVFLNVFCVYCLFKSPYMQNVDINDVSKIEFSLNEFKYEEKDGKYIAKFKELEVELDKENVKEIEVDKNDPKANTGIYTQSKVTNKLTYKNGFIKFIIKDFFLDKTNLFKNNTKQLDKSVKENYTDLILYKTK